MNDKGLTEPGGTDSASLSPTPEGETTKPNSFSTAPSPETACDDPPKIPTDDLSEARDDSQSVPAIDAKGAAESILKWAKEHRLFARQPMDDIADVIDTEPAVEVVAAQMFAVPQVEQVLRRRAINLIAFNNESSKVVIFTKSKVTAGDLKILPYAARGIAIEYTVGGVPTVRGDIPQTHDPRPFFLHQGNYCCGSSIFPANCIGAGTLGFLARDADGHIYGVTNNHVSGACNHAHPGLPILAPGPADVSDDGIDPFCIGRHSKLIPINDGIPENMDISGNLDASCFRISDTANVCSMQGNLCDTPPQVGEPISGSIVEKIGRTTGHTRGRIIGQSVAPLSVGYLLNEYSVRKSVYFQSVFIVEGLQGDFSRRGDSGSLVMSCQPDGSRVSVGLIFAGDEQKKLTYILSLPTILERLSLSICSGLNA